MDFTFDNPFDDVFTDPAALTTPAAPGGAQGQPLGAPQVAAAPNHANVAQGVAATQQTAVAGAPAPNPTVGLQPAPSGAVAPESAPATTPQIYAPPVAAPLATTAPLAGTCTFTNGAHFWRVGCVHTPAQTRTNRLALHALALVLTFCISRAPLAPLARLANDVRTIGTPSSRQSCPRLRLPAATTHAIATTHATRSTYDAIAHARATCAPRRQPERSATTDCVPCARYG